ncbi:FKBP12-associated protein [Clarireedia jacksonii]
MTTVESGPATSPAPNRPPRNRRPRRGGHRNGGPMVAQANTTPSSANIPVDSVALRPASLEPLPNSDASRSSNPNPGNNNRGGRGRRGGFGRGGRRGGPAGGAPRGQPMANGRTFGGQLTSNPVASSGSGSLAGDAPAFVPGKPVTSRGPSSRIPRPRRMSKSQAPDLATRTHEDITNGQYECVICTNEVLPNSKIWTCKTCWSVLHLSCVKKWSKNEVSTHQQRAEENGELPPPRQWRCPGCNLPKQDIPISYTCWCEKEIEPRSEAGLPPHSCGQTCSKKRTGQCPHPCELICHAGPCLPCPHMGPSLPCYCGKEAISRRCLDTKYDSGWSCEQICDDPLPCGQHKCQKKCHEGLCGSCEVPIESICYCGKVGKTLPCSERGDERESFAPATSDEGSVQRSWIGSFDCGSECRRPFDCGVPDHYCKSNCHPQDLSPAHCPLSPDVVTTCPCGRTPIDALLKIPRSDCTMPIPHCQEKCLKLLGCGHLCQGICHEGGCPPCRQAMDISCRCGRIMSESLCHQGTDEKPQCPRVCRATLNCGRHECGERCCAGEKKASERQAAKRKHRALNAPPTEENIEAEHICMKVCGRPLKCGNHTCAALCHKGPCRSCMDGIFEDISCACGRTVLQAPLPCGTKVPECHFDCTRQRTCGHPQTKHQCHTDEESCPKCPFLVEKPCICGKRTLKNVPCWFTEVRCGLPCGRKLKCGIHTCQSLCHRPGQCEDATSPCIQPCGKRKSVCDHTCTDPCHAPYPCKETTPCQGKTFITCECQHQKQAVKCLASKTSEGNSKKKLDCNDECLKLQRNAKLAAALNIDPATHADDHIPYSQQTLVMFKEMVKFCQTYEREFRVFAADSNEKRLRFKPMQPQQRAFLHSLAEDFGLDSESQDPEPHRHVSIFKTPRFVSAPAKTLAQCVKVKPATAPEATSSKQLVTTAEPFNAFLLLNPRFGLTIDEIHTDLQPEFASSGLDFDVSFLPTGDVVLRGKPSASWHTKVDAALNAMKSTVSKKVKALDLASSVLLCSVDSSLNVVRKEEDHLAGGWSQVAKGASASKAPAKPDVGVKSSFTVLGSKTLGKKKKSLERDAVDDWEKEVEAWDA